MTPDELRPYLEIVLRYYDTMRAENAFVPEMCFRLAVREVMIQFINDHRADKVGRV